MSAPSVWWLVALVGLAHREGEEKRLPGERPVELQSVVAVPERVQPVVRNVGPLGTAGEAEPRICEGQIPLGRVGVTEQLEQVREGYVYRAQEEEVRAVEASVDPGVRVGSGHVGIFARAGEGRDGQLEPARGPGQLDEPHHIRPLRLWGLEKHPVLQPGPTLGSSRATEPISVLPGPLNAVCPTPHSHGRTILRPAAGRRVSSSGTASSPSQACRTSSRQRRQLRVRGNRPPSP